MSLKKIISNILTPFPIERVIFCTEVKVTKDILSDRRKLCNIMVSIHKKEMYKATENCDYAEEGIEFIVQGKEEQNGKQVIRLLTTEKGTEIISVPKYAFEEPNPQFAWMPD